MTILTFPVPQEADSVFLDDPARSSIGKADTIPGSTETAAARLLSIVETNSLRARHFSHNGSGCRIGKGNGLTIGPDARI